MHTENIQTRALQQTDDDIDEERVRELITRIKGGDDHAFTDLVHRYRNQVAALAYRMVNDYDEAADITQIVFVKMSRSLSQYDEGRKFYTWLYRITVNASIDHMRKHNRHRHEPIENFQNSLESGQADPDQTYRRRQITDYITEVAQSLNEKQRSAFLLRDIQGCKIDDVAHIMNMPEATVRWYLHRARTKIRRELSRRYPHLLRSMGIG